MSVPTNTPAMVHPMNDDLTMQDQTSMGIKDEDTKLNDTRDEDELTGGPVTSLDTNAFGPGVHAAPPVVTVPASAPKPPVTNVPLPSISDIKQSVSDTTSAAVSSVKDNAGQAFDSTRQSAGHVIDSAKQSAGQAVDSAKQTAGHALDSAKQQVVEQINTQKARAAETLDGFKESVQEIGDTFNKHGQTMVAGYAHSFASQVDSVSTYVRESDVEKLGKDAQEFARQNPAIVIGSAFLIGIAIARFFKSSESNITSDALVPVSSASYGSGVGYGGRQDRDSDDAFVAGSHPISAHGYVSGGVLGGATE